MGTIGCDIEVGHGFFTVDFLNFHTGMAAGFEESGRSTIDKERLRAIMTKNRVITFNGNGFDIPLIWYFLEGATLAQVKQASDRIIQGRVRPWDIEKLLGIRVPRLDHIDLIEPQPNAVAGLKILAGRLHCKRLQDLPFDPDEWVDYAKLDQIVDYCRNSDLPATGALFKALEGPLALREAVGAEYKMNFLSKSDSQIGEAIIKNRVEALTGKKVEKVPTPAGTSFKYKVPPYLVFSTPEMAEILARVRESDFIVQVDGKVDLPPFLKTRKVTIGETTYAMGIGGLHSTEAQRAVYSDDEHQLEDFDVASYYPAIILGSGLYPKALGPHFLDVYRKIRDDRLVAKRTGDKVAAEGLKISLNGCYGKLGSPYSVLYAPHLMIAVTLTGQLALLMLIERAELAGIPVVSANTDGVVFRCPRDRRDDLAAITKQWEADTGFELEANPYRALYSASVNSYYAITNDGKVKRKGSVANPLTDKDMRAQLMVNPKMGVCSDAVVAFLTKGTPLVETIRACTDIRQFVTVVKVTGGASWRGEYLGKTVRYVWSPDGDPIFYITPHPTTGNFKKVSSTDGCQPLMTLPDVFPAGLLDYDRYVAEAESILTEVGYYGAPVPVVKPKRYTIAERARARRVLRIDLLLAA